MSSGSVVLFMSRVIEAIYDLTNTYVSWPRSEERCQTASRLELKYGIPVCVILALRFMERCTSLASTSMLSMFSSSATL